MGYPANDPLYDKDLDKKADELKTKLGIPKNKKVLLYAPTWRDDNSYGAVSTSLNWHWTLNA